MVMWLRLACTVQRAPFGRPDGTLILRNVRGGKRCRSVSDATAAAAAADGPKSYTSGLRSSDTAMLGMPRSDPSIAPATVPEYVTSSPRLNPLLMPDTIRSGSVAYSLVTAMLTQSLGVPSTSYTPSLT